MSTNNHEKEIDRQLTVNVRNADPEKAGWSKFVAQATAVGTLVALAASVLSLLFTLLPGLTPVGPPTKIGGSVTKVAVESLVPFGRYLRDVGLHEASRPPSGGQRPAETQLGYVISARVELTGDETHVYTAIATALSAKTLQAYAPVQGKEDSGYLSQPQVIQPDVRDFAATFRCWVSADIPPGDYIFRVALYDGGVPPKAGEIKPGPGMMVDFSDSQGYAIG